MQLKNIKNLAAINIQKSRGSILKNNLNFDKLNNEEEKGKKFYINITI
jgi:hypothetical protein